MQERKSFDFSPRVLYENRYCDQDDFSVLICGGRNKSKVVVDTVYKLDGHKLKSEKFKSMPKELYYCKTAVVNSDLFVLGGFSQNEKLSNSLFKFCNKTKTWSFKTQLRLDENFFWVCSFKKNLYVVYETGKLFVYNLKNENWFQLGDTKDKRFGSACTVFEGKIVLCGGITNLQKLKSVEAYDYYENKWTYLPDMIKERCNHATVSMGNKLIVIGGYSTSSSEVFDSYSRKFTFLRSSSLNAINCFSVRAFGIGNNIVMFFMMYDKTKVYVYDVINDHFCDLNVKNLENLNFFSCVKYSTS